MKQLMALAVFGLGFLQPQIATAETKIYPYHSAANYCPAGLQPVSINGVICCGQPNQHISYQSAMAHPAPAKKHHIAKRHVARSARVECTVGTKGCTFD